MANGFFCIVFFSLYVCKDRKSPIKYQLMPNFIIKINACILRSLSRWLFFFKPRVQILHKCFKFHRVNTKTWPIGYWFIVLVYWFIVLCFDFNCAQVQLPLEVHESTIKMDRYPMHFILSAETSNSNYNDDMLDQDVVKFRKTR